MPKYRLLTAVAAASLLAGLSVQAFAQAPAAAPAAAPAPALVAAPTAPTAPAAKLAPLGDTTSTLRASPDFTTLVKALDATNFAGMLKDRPGMTLFAPTNAAFAALPPGQLDAMMAEESKAGLRKLLLHHIINAPITSAKIKGARGPLPTGAGDVVVLDGSADGVMKADNATITQADVTSANGTIHVVDNVLIAGSVAATLPEPPPEAAPAAAPEPAPAAKPAAKATAKKK